GREFGYTGSVDFRQCQIVTGAGVGLTGQLLQSLCQLGLLLEHATLAGIAVQVPNSGESVSIKSVPLTAVWSLALGLRVGRGVGRVRHGLPVVLPVEIVLQAECLDPLQIALEVLGLQAQASLDPVSLLGNVQQLLLPSRLIGHGLTERPGLLRGRLVKGAAVLIPLTVLPG